MKTLILALALSLSATATASSKLIAQEDLSFKTQNQIIEALLNADEVKNEYPVDAEASYADLIERDLRHVRSGLAGENSKVTLRCMKIKSFTLNCTLRSYSEVVTEDFTSEHALIINAELSFDEFDQEILVSKIKVIVAG